MSIGPNGCASSASHARRLVGDPVDVVTGANVDVHKEFALPGPLPVVWRRHYDSSLHRERFALGWGHAHEYEHELRHDLNGITHVGPLGARTRFPFLAADGDARAANGLVLRRLGANRFRLERHTRPALEFRFEPGATEARLAAVVDGRRRLALTYSPASLLESMRHADGREIRIEHDDERRPVRLTLTSGVAPRVLLAYRYDQAGDLVDGTDAYGHAFSFAYDSAHRLIRRTDQRGYSFHFEYDDRGRCIYSSGEDGLHRVRLRYLPEEQCTLVTRADGGEWRYYYDGAGILTRVVDPYEGVREFVVGGDGTIIEEVDPNGNHVRLLYDAAGTEVARQVFPGAPEPEGAAAERRDPAVPRASRRPIEWEFGELTRMLAIRSARAVEPHATPFAPAGSVALSAELRRVLDTLPPAPTHNGAGGTNTGSPRREDAPARVVDPLGLLVSETTPDGSTRRYAYDASGNVRLFVDSDGSRYQADHASWSLFTAFHDPLGATTRIEYSAERQVVGVTDPAGNTRTFARDLIDRPIEVHRDGRLRERYRHDAAGNLIEKLDSRGECMIRCEIGPGNRITSRTLASGEVQRFEYDRAGRCVAMTSDALGFAFEYAATGERIGEVRSDGKSVVHALRPSGLAETTTVLDRFTVRYRPRGSDTIEITDPVGGVHRVRQVHRGRMVRRLANGTSELGVFAEDGRCIVKAATPRASPHQVWLRRYAYSGEGNVVRIEDSAEGTSVFDYDPAHRLTRATSAREPAVSFGYDHGGNLISQPGLRGTRPLAGNLLASAEGISIEYDDRDRASRFACDGTTWAFEYDSCDRLVAARAGGVEWSASYDPFGRRIQKTTNGRTTEFLWDRDRLAAEVAPDGRVRVYVYAAFDALVPFMWIDYDEASAEPKSGRPFYIFTNQIGAPTRVEDRSGAIVWRASLQPYGAAEITGVASVELHLRFPGHYFDAETGLHYNRHRYYSPRLGRYLQPDPLGVGGGVNLFAYPANPLLRVDLFGLSSDCPPTVKNPSRNPDEEDTKPDIKIPPLPDDPADAKYGDKGLPMTNRGREVDQKYPVQIMSPEQRDAHLVAAGPNGALVYPNQGNRPVHSPDGSAIYVMDQHGNVYVHENPKFGSIHHSTLAAGEQPVAAGHIAQIGDPDPQPPHMINNQSGHYEPPADRTQLTKDELSQQGVDTSSMRDDSIT